MRYSIAILQDKRHSKIGRHILPLQCASLSRTPTAVIAGIASQRSRRARQSLLFNFVALLDFLDQALDSFDLRVRPRAIPGIPVTENAFT
jgi:hypothetical protein